MPNKKVPNRLIDEKSPYLLQHTYNSVDWYPWCDEAFEKVKRENKPSSLCKSMKRFKKNRLSTA